jgi:hypothetical protein
LCFVSSRPDEPDQLVCLYDVAGSVQGRRMADGRLLIHAGLSVIVRAADYTGYALANAVASALDGVRRQDVEMPDGTAHHVQSVYRTSTVVALGEEAGKRRQLWSFSARVAFQDSEPSLG